MNANEATDALAAMQQSRERLAAAANCPPERHLAFAGIMGGLVACQAAPPFWRIGIEVVLFAVIGLVFLWDRKRTGMFINGYRSGRTRPLTFSLLAVALVVGGIGVWLKQGYGLVWAPVAAGAVVAVAAYLMSAAWQRIYLRELKAMP